MTLFTSRALAALLAASAMTVAAPIAVAQQAQQPQSEAQAADIAEEDLQKFALAAIEVQRVNQAYQPRFQEAESEDEQQQIQQQAAQEAAEAVQQAGLTVEEYNQYSRIAVENPQVAERVNEYIQEILPEQQ